MHNRSTEPKQLKAPRQKLCPRCKRQIFKGQFAIRDLPQLPRSAQSSILSAVEKFVKTWKDEPRYCTCRLSKIDFLRLIVTTLPDRKKKVLSNLVDAIISVKRETSGMPVRASARIKNKGALFALISRDVEMRFLAACKKDPAIAESMIRSGMNVNVQDEDGVSALMHAIQRGHSELVQSLLISGADVNHEDRYGYTPLILAAELGRLQTIDALVDFGVKLNKRTVTGNTAIMHSEFRGQTAATIRLFQLGAWRSHMMKAQHLMKFDDEAAEAQIIPAVKKKLEETRHEKIKSTV